MENFILLWYVHRDIWLKYITTVIIDYLELKEEIYFWCSRFGQQGSLTKDLWIAPAMHSSHASVLSMVGVAPAHLWIGDTSIGKLAFAEFLYQI
jgi:hypothetical protein